MKRFLPLLMLTGLLFAQDTLNLKSGESFTAYNSITQDWCKAKVLAALGETEDEVKAKLDARITEQKTPTVLTGTPSGW